MLALSIGGQESWNAFARMKTKTDIVTNWLPRYTGTAAKDFSKYILLVNFTDYVSLFAEAYGTRVRGIDRPMPNATANGITILNFGKAPCSRRLSEFASGRPELIRLLRRSALSLG